MTVMITSGTKATSTVETIAEHRNDNGGEGFIVDL